MTSTLQAFQATTTSAQVTAVITMPVGTVVSYLGNVAPNGWLICDGRALDAGTYPALYPLLPNGKLPDLRSRFIVGAGNGANLTGYEINNTGGVEAVTLNESQMPTHQHFGFGEAYDDWPLGTSGKKNNMGSKGGKDNDNYYYGTTYAGGNQSHENRPPYYALTYIIKY